MTVITVDGLQFLGRTMTRAEREVFPQAMARSLNRVASTVKSRSVKDVAKATGLKSQSVGRRIILKKRASKNSLTASVEASGRPLNLISFQARELKTGVSAKPWGRRQKFREAFFATMPNGATLVVTRIKGKKIRTGPNKGAPAIKAMYGPGIAKEAAEPALDTARRKVVAERMPIEFGRELRFRVSKLR